MIAVDTSSLNALVKYFLYFDKSNKLYEEVKKRFLTGELLILDCVYEECKYVSKGIILEKLDFLNDKKLHIKTDELLPTKAFFGLVNQNFCNQDQKRLKGINEAEFNLAKEDYLKSADCKQILFAFLNKHKEVIICTEESKAANDGKLFKKIPDCCDSVNVECCTLPSLLKEKLGIDLANFFS